MALILSLGILTASTALAEDKSKDRDPTDKDKISVAATPEMDSLALFATGAAGMVSYGVLRFRGRKR
jgi:hypothetical protein